MPTSEQTTAPTKTTVFSTLVDRIDERVPSTPANYAEITVEDVHEAFLCVYSDGTGRNELCFERERTRVEHNSLPAEDEVRASSARNPPQLPIGRRMQSIERPPKVILGIDVTTAIQSSD